MDFLDLPSTLRACYLAGLWNIANMDSTCNVYHRLVVRGPAENREICVLQPSWIWTNVSLQGELWSCSVGRGTTSHSQTWGTGSRGSAGKRCSSLPGTELCANMVNMVKQRYCHFSSKEYTIKTIKFNSLTVCFADLYRMLPSPGYSDKSDHKI